MYLTLKSLKYGKGAASLVLSVYKTSTYEIQLMKYYEIQVYAHNKC